MQLVNKWKVWFYFYQYKTILKIYCKVKNEVYKVCIMCLLEKM